LPDVTDIYRNEFRARVLGGRPRSIVEIGAGDGAFLSGVRDEVMRLCGVEPGGEHVAVLRAQGFETVQASAERLPFADGEFDVAVFSFTPHHLADWGAALREALRVARHSVEILDVWYDETVADQRTARAYDCWLKAIDRRTGMAHMDTLSPGLLLAPAQGRPDATYDYSCRRVTSRTNIEEAMAKGREYLARAGDDPALAKELDSIIAAARRDGMTDEGAILMTIEK
jgi:ubiquinone/menaquinone biosynthesis C-methylase UbiE